MEEAWRASAREIARRVCSGEATAVGVIESHLARIAQVNPALNAIVHVDAEGALAAARAADDKVRKGRPLGPLHGVPFTVKENIDVAGQPTTWGVGALAKAVPPDDAPVVARMRAAGAILIGRTNMPDMGLRMATESSLYGKTENPWRKGRTASGSSGGDAAALAAGMTAIGLGNDLGGSLRNPAAACGVVGFRPGAGRVPHAGYFPSEEQMLFSQLMLAQGPLARNIADVRVALQILAGAHPRDPRSLDAPLVGTSLAKPLRVAVMANPPGGDTHPAITAAVRRAAGKLADAGYDLVEAVPPAFEEILDVWRAFIAADFGPVLVAKVAPLMGDAARRVVQHFVAGAISDLPSFSRLMARRDRIARAWSRFMASHPLVLTPTWCSLPFEHGFDEEEPDAVMAMARPVFAANLLGLPSVSVPAGTDQATGLPIGVLVTGPFLREDLCLDAAEVVEEPVTPIDPRG